MTTYLVLHLCTVLTRPPNPPCRPQSIPQVSKDHCLAKAEFFNSTPGVPRTWLKEKARNEIALTQPARCESRKP